MARLGCIQRESKRRDGSGSDAPLAKVSFNRLSVGLVRADDPPIAVLGIMRVLLLPAFCSLRSIRTETGRRGLDALVALCPAFSASHPKNDPGPRTDRRHKLFAAQCSFQVALKTTLQLRLRPY